MNDKYIFINNAMNDSIIRYYQSKDEPNSLTYNTFLVCVMRMIILIYGELDITNCYHTRNEHGMGGFDTNMTKYGYPLKELEKFKDNFEKYYEFDMRQSKLHIKKKNPYFNRVQKNLIDMMFTKNKMVPLDGNTAQEFYNLLFTANSKDFYRKTYALLMTNKPYEIDEYFRKNMFIMSNRLTFKEIKKRLMSQEIYDYLGIAQNVVEKLTQQQIDSVNSQILNYYKIDFNDSSKEEKLISAISTSKKRPVININA